MNRRAFLAIPFDVESPLSTQAEKHDAAFVTTPAAGYPREYARHTWVLVEDTYAWLGRDELGFYAVDALCPHMGGLVRPIDKGYVCRCHGSEFGTTGDVRSGPARRQLRYLRVDLDSSGKLVIRRDQAVSPDERFIA